MMELNEYEDVAVLSLNGELGPDEVRGVEQTLFSLLKTHHRKMVLNFSDVDHVHYPSAEALMGAVRKMKNYHADLKFAAMNDYTRKIFRFVGAQESFESFETVPDAVISFSSNWRTWH